MPGFVDDYECDPKLPHYGFKSWDDFFTRKFRPGRRPVASPDNDYIVANACESAPYKLARGVKHRDFFWIKNQRYSLDFILNMNPLAQEILRWNRVPSVSERHQLSPMAQPCLWYHPQNRACGWLLLLPNSQHPERPCIAKHVTGLPGSGSCKRNYLHSS